MTSPLGAAVWATSASGPLLLTATLSGVELPVALLGAALVAHVSLVGVAVACPGLEAFGPAVTRAPRGVALTFDDGPDPVHTPRVLDALAARGAKATFFVVGERLAAHPALARRMAAEGHTIGAHGWTHDPLYALRSRAHLARDMAREDAAHVEVVGRAPTLFRPPVGVASPPVVDAARARGRSIVAWTTRPRDGRARAAVDAVTRRAARGLTEGAIVLLHDAAMGARARPAAVDALPEILEEMARRGLEARALEG